MKTLSSILLGLHIGLVCLTTGCESSRDFDADYTPPPTKSWETFLLAHRDEVLGKVISQRFYGEISKEQLEVILTALVNAYEKEAEFSVVVQTTDGADRATCSFPYPLYFISGRYLKSSTSNTVTVMNLDPRKGSAGHKDGAFLFDDRFIETLRAMRTVLSSSSGDVSIDSPDQAWKQTYTLSGELMTKGKIYFQCNSDPIPIKGGHRHADHEFGFSIKFTQS